MPGSILFFGHLSLLFVHAGPTAWDAASAFWPTSPTGGVKGSGGSYAVEPVGGAINDIRGGQTGNGIQATATFEHIFIAG